MPVEEYVRNANTRHQIYAYNAHWDIILRINYVFSANQTAYNAASPHKIVQHVHWGISCKQPNVLYVPLTA